MRFIRIVASSAIGQAGKQRSRKHVKVGKPEIQRRRLQAQTATSQ